MHVSVSKLGGAQTQAQQNARAIVDYLTGQPASQPQSVSARSTRGGYYTDSPEGPGRWHGQGAEEFLGAGAEGFVKPEHLERLLLGQDPTTGVQLVEAAGSAKRADSAKLAHIDAASTGPAEELLSSAQVAKLAGITESRYINRIAANTAKARLNSVGSEPNLPRSFIHGHKMMIEGRGRPEWRFRRDEVERFIAARTEPQRVMGYDITYSASKETSVAWAAADDPGRQRIESHLAQAAVGRALDYVEDNAVFVGRGAGSRQGAGMVAASFLHKTSRNLEPQLHVHVVVPNMARTPSGRWQTFDGRAIYAQASTSGYLAEAEFKNRMSAEGYVFDRTVKGISHIQGIPDATVKAMSSRRTEILSEVGLVGADSPKARQIAAFHTRADKTTDVTISGLEPQWREVFAETGFGPDQQHALTRSKQGLGLWRPEDTEALHAFLVSPNGVTRDLALFDRRRVLQTIVDYSDDRLTAVDVQRLADAFLGSHDAIPLNLSAAEPLARVLTSAVPPAAVPGVEWFTTPQMIALEQNLIATYAAGFGVGAARLAPSVVAGAVEEWEHTTGLRLGADQVAMVSAITQSGDRFQSVLGPAGSGKTTGLRVAADAWRAAGYELIGASVNSGAADVLGRETGIPSDNVASLLGRIDRADRDGRPLLTAHHVVIVDEASTLSNREYARVVAAVDRAGAALRLVGDPHQHRAVEAGGLWAHLVSQHTDRTPKLIGNRRMTGNDMNQSRLAIAEFRQGHRAAAVSRLAADGRIVTAESPVEILDTMAADWFVQWRRHLEHPEQVKPTRMMAESHAARRALNARAQTILQTHGRIGDAGVEFGDSTFHVGDRVIARAISRRLHPEGDRAGFVRNGSKGTVTQVLPEVGNRSGGLVVDFDHKGSIVLPVWFLNDEVRPGVRGGLTPGYAVTTHAAQGETYNAGLSLATDTSTSEGQYVAWTRGRNDLAVYFVESGALKAEPPPAEHGLPIIDRATGAAAEEITAAVSRDTPGQIATVSDPEVGEVARHLRVHTLREVELLESLAAQRAAQAMRRRAVAAVVAEPPALLVALIGARPGQPELRMAVDKLTGSHTDTETGTEVWDRAAAAYGLYQQRWDEPFVEGSVHLVPGSTAHRDQHDDYRALRSAIVEARAYGNRDLAPTQLATARAELIGRLDHNAGSRALHDGVTHELHRRVNATRDDVAQLTRNHRLATNNRARRRDPDAPERLRRQLESAKRDHALAVAHLTDHRRTLADDQTTAEASERVRLELDVLNTVINTASEEALTQPATYRAALLGPKPKAETDATAWDHAAKRIEIYRIGTLGLTPEDGAVAEAGNMIAQGIGSRPHNVGQAGEWDRVAQSVSSVTRDVNQLPPPRGQQRQRG